MPTSRTDGEAGFTLLELLSVLVILVLAAAAVLRAGGGSAETAEVRSFLIRAEAMMRQARTTAVETSSVQDVVIDTRLRRLVHEGGGLAIEVPAGVALDGVVARVPEKANGAQVVRFFPDGGSTGATLPFRFRGDVYVLRVNWLTGHADVRRG
ncbi:MAG: prepilin-type N-terminal cleavage/methylation domain-containing protein [Aestuariivirga sp.]|nr:prepilin-type N-terminal cleavage/methylation domain-containing protein [Aestuariivirga sp.]